MKRRFLVAAVAAAAFSAAFGSGTVRADGGNVATGSVGSTQVGSTGSAPSVDATSPTGSASIVSPVGITGSSGNTASGSVGTAQVGGGNSAGGSVVTGQVSSVDGKPHAHFGIGGANGDSSSGASMPSGDHSANGTFLQVQAGQPSVSSQNGANPPTGLAIIGIGPLSNPTVPVSLAAPSNVNSRFGADVRRDYNFVPALLLLQATSVGVTPDVFLGIDPLASLLLGGYSGTGPNDGNSATASPGTAQAGSVSIAPTGTLDVSALDSGLTFGGGSGVDGAGTNTASSSPGTGQLGGGNVDGSSPGTLQIGGVSLGPAFNVMTPLGALVLGGGSGIAGGSNSASGSPATVQIGGGNSADGSPGTVQSGGPTVAPSVAATGTSAGDASLGGSSSVAGSGNDATGSPGTVQVGGGNVASGSPGTTQSGGVTVGPTVSAAGDTVSSPTNIGEGTGNTATGSPLTVEIGGGNTVTGSILSILIGRPLSPPPPGGGGGGSNNNPGCTGSCGGQTPTSQTGGTSSPATTPVGNKPGEVAPSASSTATSSQHPQGVLAAPVKTVVGSRSHSSSGSLPFSGFDLTLVLAFAALLLGTGLGLRLAAKRI